MGSKAYFWGLMVSLSRLSSQYVLNLRAVNCRSGDVLAEEQQTASSKEKVLDALDKAASSLCSRPGESRDGAEI